MTKGADFTIIGAGLAGSLMAIYLAQLGYRVDVYESRGDMRQVPVPRGRSINLALSTRGLSALQEVGMKGDILHQAIPMRGRMVHTVGHEPQLQRYSIHAHEFIYSVSRHGLNVALLDQAASFPGVRLFFDHKCLGIEVETGRVRFLVKEELKEVEARSVIGADGAHSAVRGQLQRMDRFDYSQNFLDWGYKELTMPALAGGRHALATNALHLWPRHDFLLIALPNLDGSFTCTLFLPFEGPRSFEALRGEARVRAFFRQFFPDAVPHMPTLADDFRHNPTSSLAYVRCSPWHYRDNIVLIGDACHAVVPFYGQGMNAAFEDCSILAALIQKFPSRRAVAFEEYQSQRKRHVDALADLSLQNFVEMRDSVTHSGFRMKKATENLLHRLFPRSFVPLYSMVTFSRTPYADAVRQARSQDRLLLALGLAAVGGASALAAALITTTRRREPRQAQ